MYKLLVLAMVLVAANQCFSAPVDSCPSEDTNTAIFIADDTYCNAFYECSNGAAYEVLCPPTTNFDPTKNVCSYEYTDCGTKGQKAGTNPTDAPEVPTEATTKAPTKAPANATTVAPTV